LSTIQELLENAAPAVDRQVKLAARIGMTPKEGTSISKPVADGRKCQYQAQD
jgi:hypothetical protein